MRNLKKVLSLALVLMMVLSVVSGAAYIGYSDEDTITAINEDYIVAAKLLNELGIVVGSVNETGAVVYDGQGAIDRAQLARVLYVLYSGNTEYSKIYNPGEAFMSLACPFTDIDGNWAEGYIKYGYNKGYLNGKDNNKYDPTANVTAAEMATALLAVIGYSKADLAKNWPSNVILYGYEGVSGNLFTTGLSVQNQDPTVLANDGWHVLGMDALVETEDELSIDEELTREQAFYMMYRAINNRCVKGANYTFVQKVFGSDAGAYYDDEWYTGTIIGTKNNALVGSKATKDVVVCGDSWYGNYYDLGYTAVQGKSSVTGKAKAYGYNLSATDWDAHLGQRVRFRDVCINGKSYITNYMFEYDAQGNAKFNGFMGTGITTVENVEKTNIDDAFVAGYGFWTVGGKDTYDLTINGKVFSLSADEFATEIGEASGKKTHDLVTKITLVDGKIYSAEMQKYSFAIIDKDGKIGDTKVVNDTYHIGDGVFFYIADDKPVIVRKATKLWNQTLAVKTEGSKTTVKYGDTEIVYGDAYFDGYCNADSNTLASYDITHTYNLWVDGGYVFGSEQYDAKAHEDQMRYDNVRVATFDSIACVKAYNTTDRNYVYTYTVTVKTADGTAYTFTFKKHDELTDNELLSYKIHQEVIKWSDLLNGGTSVNPVTYTHHYQTEDAFICQRALAYYVIDNLETGEYEVIREKPSLFKKGFDGRAHEVRVAFEFNDWQYYRFVYLMDKTNVDKTFAWTVVDILPENRPQ